MTTHLRPDYTRRAMPKRPGEATHDLSYVEYRGEYIDLKQLADQSVDANMLTDLSMDLATRKQLPPKLTDDALVQTAENYLNQCSPEGHAVTYEGMLLQHIVPELVARMKQKDDEKTER